MYLLVLGLVLVSLLHADAQSACTTPKGRQGECVLLSNCNELFSLLPQSKNSPEIYNLLKSSYCGSDGDSPKVCCELRVTTTKAPVTGSSCNTPRGIEGRCVQYTSCPEIAAIITSPNQTPAQTQFAKQSSCGFDGKIPMVCCGSSSSTTTTSDSAPETRVKGGGAVPLTAAAPPKEPCVTPRNYNGDCIPITECAELYAVLTKSGRTEGEGSFLRRSFCGYKGQIAKVCCELEDQTRVNSFTSSRPKECMQTDEPPNPDGGCCGRDGVSGNKITGGAPTSLDQYPWLALLEFDEGGVISTLCGGTLISRRHVLTAAHCVKGRSAARRKLVNVRLGEYDTSSIIDSLDTEGGGQDFSDKLVTIGVASIVAHTAYDPEDESRKNDIAIIRLVRPAPYTDFIRPICLPVRDTTVNRPDDYKLYAAGWGSNNVSRENSPIKNFVDLPYVDFQQCQNIYGPGTRRSVDLWDRQLCAGGEANKDACKGDSGGPLMYENGPAYELVGITSYGVEACGEGGIPGIYTKVYEYLDWIRNNL